MRGLARPGLLALALVGAAGAPGCAMRKAPVEQAAEAPDAAAFLGTWTVRDSTAVFRVYLAGGELRVEGWDSSDGERFEVTGVSLAGGALRFTTRMPSTDWTVHHTLVPEGETLRNQRRGASTNVGIWVRAADLKERKQ